MSPSGRSLGAPDRWGGILAAAAALLGADHVRLVGLRPGRAEVLAAGGPDPDGPVQSRVTRRAPALQETLSVADLAADPDWRSSPEADQGWRAVLAAPVASGGAIAAFRRAPGPFPPAAADHLGHLAEWAAADGALGATGNSRDPEFPLAGRVAEMAGRIRDVYFEVALNGVILDVSPAVEAVAGVSRDQLIGRPAIDFYENPAERGLFLETVLREGRVADYPAVLRDGEGRPRHFSVSAVLETDESGRPGRVVGALRDVGERRLVEERLAESRRLNGLLLDSLPYPAMLIREDRMVAAANRIAREMGAKVGGYCWCDFAGSANPFQKFDPAKKIDPDQKILPEAARESSPAPPAPCRFCLAEEVFRTGEARRNPDLQLRGETWDTWWVPVDEELFLHYAINVTDRKAQEAELEAARRAAEKSSQAKSHFLANMSHEIRTPMNAAIGMIELALDDELPPRARDMLETARLAAGDLRALLDDILDLSKIEAGQLALEIADFHLGRLVEDVMRTQEPQAQKKGLTLRTHLAPDVPARFRGAPRRLRQVLNNLVGNAVKFTRTGGVTVTAGLDPGAGGDAGSGARAEASSESPSAAPPETGGQTVLRFAVCDTGPGIPPDQLERVFDAFSRGDDATQRRFEGTGLGATISRELVEAMGGELGVESRLGEGSTFVFTIRGEALDDAGREPAAPPADFDAAAPLRVLLVEDNPMNQKLVVNLLEARGHAVTVANGGREALETFAPGRFDVVFMDIQMPGLDGLETTRRLRDRETPGGPRVPIFALSARVLDGEPTQVLAAGMDGFIAKPIRREELFGVLARLASPDSPPRESPAAPEPGEAPLDRENLLEIVGGMPRIARELVRLYRQNCPDLVEKVQRAAESGDAAGLKESAHALKGMSLNLSAAPVAEAALRLERMGRSGDLSRAGEVLKTLEHALDRLWDELDIFLETLAPD
jgi:PAS domain S-box-containing protein